MWFLYILKCVDGTLYTGIARDPEKRFLDHKTGKGAAYTKIHKPEKIVYLEQYSTVQEAMKREWQIKKWSRIKKNMLIQGLYSEPGREKL